MKIFSFKMNNTNNLYLWVIKGVNIDDAFVKLQEHTNLAKNKSDFSIKELDMDVNVIS